MLRTFNAMEAVLAPPVIQEQATGRHLLVVLDRSPGDELLINLGAYSTAMTGGRVSLILLPGEPASRPWLWRRATSLRLRTTANAYLRSVEARMRSMGARVDRVRIGDRAAAAMLGLIRESGVDVVAASSPPPLACDSAHKITGSTAALALVPPAD